MMATTLPAAGDKDTLWVMDLSGYVFRAYHGMRELSNSKGEPTHAVLGVTNMINALVRNYRPYFLAVAMDSTTDTFRHVLYPKYKANRPPAPVDLAQQMARCREVAEVYAIPVLQRDGWEADDLIATVVRYARAAGLKTIVCTGDKDLHQLVSSDVTVWDAMRQNVFGPAEVKEKWGVEAGQLRDLLALMGDSSDNVPGVAHVGEKTAAKLLNEHGTLDGIYANLTAVKGKTQDYLREHEPEARLSHTLVGLDDNVPMEFDLEALQYGGFDTARVRALFVDLEFQRLVDALDRESKTVTVSAAAEVTAPAVKALYESVQTVEALDEAIAQCRAAGVFAIDTETTSLQTTEAVLVGVSLSWRAGYGVYIPVGHRALVAPKQLDKKLVLDRLRPLLADVTVKKLGQNIKYDDVILRRAGVPVEGYDFDTMLASYLIDPERHSHKLDEISKSELGYEMVPFEAVCGKGKKQITFDQVEIEAATRYAAEDAEVVVRLTEKLRPRIDADGLGALLRDVEVPLARVLGRMEETGILLDVSLLHALSTKTNADIARLEADCHAAAGKIFNVNAPRQLEVILFDDLSLPVLKRTKTSRSTDAEVLEELSSQHPLPAKILELRSLTKLQGTYLQALPAMVGTDGRVHTSYHQAVAATGRLSSSDPNLQNIPVRTPLGREIRRAFIAPAGHQILSADYSQIELRVLAHLSRDPILVDAFTRDEDVHRRTASEIFGVPVSEVTRAMRDKAKTTNFAVIYGQGEASLAKQLGVPREEASEFIKKYFETFSVLKSFLDETVARAHTDGVVHTLLGRRRALPDLRSTNRALRLAAERMATNTPVQGTAADIIKLAMLGVEEKLETNGFRAKMLLTVHDELVFEVPDAERDSVETTVRTTMESAVALSVPLVVSCGWGLNWADAH